MNKAIGLFGGVAAAVAVFGFGFLWFCCRVYVPEGQMAIVTGRLQIRDWTDRDGNKRTSAEVVADNVYFGDSKRDRGENGGGYQAPRGNDGYQPRSNEAYQSRGSSYQSFDSAPSASAFSELSDTDGELPF